ncbi:MAG: glycogen/starch synthase, partial [Synergistaceae bacterium]|nr:glycogen/starch synthase [Synergistaceae bacterium]
MAVKNSGNALKVLFVTTELAPFSKVGGLGDVAG